MKKLTFALLLASLCGASAVQAVTWEDYYQQKAGRAFHGKGSAAAKAPTAPSKKADKSAPVVPVVDISDKDTTIKSNPVDSLKDADFDTLKAALTDTSQMIPSLVAACKRIQDLCSDEQTAQEITYSQMKELLVGKNALLQAALRTISNQDVANGTNYLTQARLQAAINAYTAAQNAYGQGITFGKPSRGRVAYFHRFGGGDKTSFDKALEWLNAKLG